MVVELDSDPDDLRGYVAERARDLGCADLVPAEWRARATQAMLIRRQTEAFESPVSISESLSGLAHGYDGTGYSIGHLNTAYRLDCSEASLRHELHGIADRLEEAMEVVDNASVIQTYRANLEKRIRAGIIAKAALTNDGEAPDPDAVELAYQRHFARAVPAAVERASSVLGKFPVPQDDLSEVDDDDEDGDDEDPVAEAEQPAKVKGGKAPKYVFGRLNKAWKPSSKAGADRFEKRTALMQKMRDLWKSGAKKGDKEWDSTVAALRGTETMRERRSRYLGRMDSIKARMAAGKTTNSRGENLADVQARVRLRLKRVQKTMKAKGVSYQSASLKSADKPAAKGPAKGPAGKNRKRPAGSGVTGAPAVKGSPAREKRRFSRRPGQSSEKVVRPLRGKTPPPKRTPVVAEAADLIRALESRLEEHPGDHDQRVHSPTGRAAIALDKAGSRLGGQTPAMLQAQKKALMVSKGKQVVALPYRQGVGSAIAARNQSPAARLAAKQAIAFGRKGSPKAARSASRVQQYRQFLTAKQAAMPSSTRG